METHDSIWFLQRKQNLREYKGKPMNLLQEMCEKNTPFNFFDQRVWLQTENPRKRKRKGEK
ncbi:hypothetical protein HanPSC8_Chr05g0227951 [Helianthus annuus]|nr:hypothetical protein HanPSC8_Chr05g0227951 [Helianthus annuus]